MCYNCFRPSPYCVCGMVAPFEAHCKILILQHPHERKKYYSTAKLVLNTLTNAKMLRGLEFAPGQIERSLSESDAYLLFPSEDAKNCEDTVLTSKSTVIVVDGTWSEAGKIIRRNEILRKLPCLTFKRDLRSNYRIRKQPKDNYLSTIECIGHLLKLNAEVSGMQNTNQSYDKLFELFNCMVEKQLKHFPRFSALPRQ